jgi:hypothetical protein
MKACPPAHYELAVDAPHAIRVPVAFIELAHVSDPRPDPEFGTSTDSASNRAKTSPNSKPAPIALRKRRGAWDAEEQTDEDAEPHAADHAG